MPPTPTPEFVRRVNEVFHDLDSTAYAKRHPEIFAAETARWESIAAVILDRTESPRTILDVGCGTGFVASQLANRLTSLDRIINADVSTGMLDQCRQTLAAGRFACGMDYRRIASDRLPVDDASADVVTLNSVLHHLADPAAGLREIDRVLKPGGIVAIAHEPNARFYSRKSLRAFAAAWLLVASPRSVVGSVARVTGLMPLLRRLIPGDEAALLAKLNARLIEDGTLDAPLTQDELTAIVDFHSPTAGGYRKGKGLDPDAILAALGGGYRPILRFTYDHLGSGTSASPLATRLAKPLVRRHPDHGATFVLVATKPA